MPELHRRCLVSLPLLAWSVALSCGPGPTTSSRREFVPSEGRASPGRVAPLAVAARQKNRSGVRALVEAEGNRYGVGLCVVKENDTARCGCVVSADPSQPPAFKVIPRPVSRLSGVRVLAQAGDHRCLLGADGTVRCRGNNGRGQLGLGHLRKQRVWMPVPGLAGMVDLSASWRATCAVRKDGTVWCWGDSAYGQSGDGGEVCGGGDSDAEEACRDRRLRRSPTRVVGLTAASAVRVSYGYACALRRDGTVWCWGRNHRGQLGNGSRRSTSKATRVRGLTGVTALEVDENRSCAVRRDGTLWCWPVAGRGRPAPAQVAGLNGVREVTTGADHTCVIAARGEVWCWGANKHGQLGDGTTTARPAPTRVKGLTGAEVLLGLSRSTCAARADGGLYCWGAIGLRQRSARQRALTPRKVKLIGQ